MVWRARPGYLLRRSRRPDPTPSREVSYLVGQTSPATCRAGPTPAPLWSTWSEVGGVVLGSADRLLRSAETTPFDSKICPLRTGASSSDLGSRKTSNSSVGMLHARNRKGCLGQTGSLLPKSEGVDGQTRLGSVRCRPTGVIFDRVICRGRARSLPDSHRHRCLLLRGSKIDGVRVVYIYIYYFNIKKIIIGGRPASSADFEKKIESGPSGIRLT